MISNFQRFPCSAHLYSLEFSLKEYADSEQLHGVFSQAFEMVVQKSIGLFDSIETMNQNYNVVDDFFGFVRKYL